MSRGREEREERGGGESRGGEGQQTWPCDNHMTVNNDKEGRIGPLVLLCCTRHTQCIGLSVSGHANMHALQYSASDTCPLGLSASARTS